MRVLVLITVLVCGCTAPTSPAVQAACPVTTPPPVAVAPPPPAGTGPNAGLVFQAGPNEFLYGNDALVVILPNDGTIHPSDPSRGLAGGVKFAWNRVAPGTLAIATDRLDGTSTARAADIPGGYGELGFQPTGLNFESPGCWRVSGTLGNKTLTFVVKVAP